MSDKPCIWCTYYKREIDEARDAFSRSVTEGEHLIIQNLRKEIREMQLAAERRNRDLDAMHLVWCDGGCPGGVHRYDEQGPSAITQEIVDAAVRNTERLQKWWRNRQGRLASLNVRPR